MNSFNVLIADGTRKRMLECVKDGFLFESVDFRCGEELIPFQALVATEIVLICAEVSTRAPVCQIHFQEYDSATFQIIEPLSETMHSRENF
jgi:hypothetical protein